MGSVRTASPLLVLLLMLSAPGAWGQTSGAPIIYCCDDANGRPVCGDVLPRQCIGRAYREMTIGGIVKREVSAPLTREERARREAEERARRADEALQRIQRRQDEALMETYPTLEAIADREERALAEVDRSIEGVLEREQELLTQRKELEEEAKFYEGRVLPRELETALRLTDTELAAYRSVIVSKEDEKQSIRERFAADRKRYQELVESGFGGRE